MIAGAFNLDDCHDQFGVQALHLGFPNDGMGEGDGMGAGAGRNRAQESVWNCQRKPQVKIGACLRWRPAPTATATATTTLRVPGTDPSEQSPCQDDLLVELLRHVCVGALVQLLDRHPGRGLVGEQSGHHPGVHLSSWDRKHQSAWACDVVWACDGHGMGMGWVWDGYGMGMGWVW